MEEKNLQLHKGEEIGLKQQKIKILLFQKEIN
jgi:hypothetical protein